MVCDGKGITPDSSIYEFCLEGEASPGSRARYLIASERALLSYWPQQFLLGQVAQTSITRSVPFCILSSG